MWRNQVGQLDKLVLERRRHVVVFLALSLVLVPFHLDPFLARPSWTTSGALGGHLGDNTSIGVSHGESRDRTPLGVRDVQQTADRLVFLLELRSHVLARRNPTPSVRQHLEGRFLSDRRQRYDVVSVALPELSR